MMPCMMSLKDQLLYLARHFAAATGTKGRDGQPSLSGVSTRIFGDGKTFSRLLAGGDVTTGSFEKALAWFSENWPDGVEWPSQVVRPHAREGEAA